MFNLRIKNILKAFSGDSVLITDPKNRYYFSGFTGTDAALLLTRDENFIFTDSRYHIQAKQQAKDFTLIDSAKTSPSDLINQKKLSYIGFEEETMTVRAYDSMSKKLERATLEGVSALIKDIRKIKDDTEIGYIRHAAGIADKAFSYILGEIKPGLTEKELALKLEFFMRDRGAEGLSFDTIFASGVRSAMPHGVASYKKIENGDLVTIDFGCLYKGYASDMTRTVVLGSANEKQKEIYNIVLDAHNAALAAVRPGAKAKDIDSLARGIIERAGYGDNFGHSLGHSLGLDVHEFPSLSPKSEEILMPRMFVTDEPGIYIDGFGGVRIEDLLLVTDDGCDDLTTSDKNLIIL